VRRRQPMLAAERGKISVYHWIIIIKQEELLFVQRMETE
jgi:hypothetical protein